MAAGKKVVKGIIDKFGALPDDPVDESKRKFMKGVGGAALAAGALSKIPLSKMVTEAVPEIAETAKEMIPKGFDFNILNTFTNRMEDAKDLAIREGRAGDIPMLDEYQVSDLIEGGVDEDDVFDMIAEMKAKYPGATSQQIYDEFSKISDTSLDDLNDLFDADGGLLSVIEDTDPREVLQIEPADIDALLEEYADRQE